VTDAIKNLNQFSATLLSGLLATGEWYENPGQLYRAGQILEEVLPEIPAEPRLLAAAPSDAELSEFRTRHKAWASAAAPWKRDPTPKEIEVIKACVKKFAETKRLGGSIHLLPLLNLAALKPED
jgi:hypothetical protein